MKHKGKNAKNGAYEQIQNLILGMDIRPGETITEIALSNRLGIGRTPVREALKKLEQEGLVITVNRRKKVYVLTVKELEEIFEIKVCLESRVASKAAKKISPAEAKHLSKILADMKAASELVINSEEDEKKRLDTWMEADGKLHHALFQIADNAKVEAIANNLDLQWQRLRLGMYTLEGRIQRSYLEHELIINEILDKKPKEAGQAMDSHLTNVKNELVKLFRMFNYPVG